MKYKRTSTCLIIIGGMLLILNLLSVYMVYNTINLLKNDARIINQAGVIRGLIQRISKIEISGGSVSDKSIISEVDHLFAVLLSEENKKYFQKEHRGDFPEYIESVQLQWQELKKIITDYRNRPTELIKNRLISKSEECWKSADAAVLQAQLAAENKVWGIRMFYIFLLIYALSTILVIWIVYSFVRNKLEYQASHDSLTGLLNRFSYEKQIENELERSKRYKNKLSVILFDVDHFKNVNDNFGHKTGDHILTKLAQTVKNSIRKSDLLFRVGGEEFAIITPESDLNESSLMAEKIRKNVENYFLNEEPSITISLGISECKPDKKCSEMYREADEALYRAKKSGRNRVEIFQN